MKRSLILVAILAFLPIIGCAGRSETFVPGGGSAAAIGNPTNAFSETREDGTVETAIGPVITARTRVNDGEYVTHGPGQASSIIIRLFLAMAGDGDEDLPIEFDVQTVANWRADQISYDPQTGGFTVMGMEVSASAIIDAANTIYPELTRMIEAGSLTEQQAWQVMSSVMEAAIETAGAVVNPASGIGDVIDGGG